MHQRHRQRQLAPVRPHHTGPACGASVPPLLGTATCCSGCKTGFPSNQPRRRWAMTGSCCPGGLASSALNLAHRALRQQASAEVSDAEPQQADAEAALATAPAGPISQAALQAVVSARRRHVAASMLCVADHEATRRRCVVADGKRPCHAITRIISRPASASQVAALRTPSGGLAVSGRQMHLPYGAGYGSLFCRHIRAPRATPARFQTCVGGG